MKRPTKKRKAFRTSPSIRVPRAAIQKLQESKAQAQAQARDIDLYLQALMDAVKLIDIMHQRAGKRPLPLLDGPEVKRLEEIRLLSIGI